MTTNNPALDALQESLSEEKEETPLNKLIVNGINTCGPLIRAVLKNGSSDIQEDMNELIKSAKYLIDDVYVKTGVKKETDHNIKAAINALCIYVVSENWQGWNEVFSEWPDVISESIKETGLTAEHMLPGIKTIDGINLSANISASGKLICAIYKSECINDKDDAYCKCTTALFESINKCIKKLSSLHVPYEDTEVIRSEITKQSSEIFSVVIERYVKDHNDSLRISAAKNDTNNTEFSIDEACRYFTVAMESFVSAIYTNSRIVV